MLGSSKKIAILDSARGICAFIVALYHFLHFSSPQGDLFDVNHPFIATISPFMPGIVCVFFLISGYVIYLHLERNDYRITDFPRFLFRRMIRLQVPLLACILLILGINTIFQMNAGMPIEVDWSRFFANFSLSANFVGEEWYNPIFWTLSIELQFYIFIGLTYLIIRRFPFPWLFGLSLLALAINSYFNTRGTFVEFGSYFTIGISMYLYHQKRLDVLYVFFLSAIGILDFYLNQAPLYYISSVLFIPIILFVKSRSKLLEFAGDISFSFYLIHGAVGGLFLYFTARHVDQLWMRIALLIAAILISYCAAYIFYLLIEKTSSNLVKRIRYKRTN